MFYFDLNFSKKLPAFSDGDVFAGCFFACAVPGTKIIPAGFVGKISFVKGCNLQNCNIFPGVADESCLKIDYVNPPPEPENKYTSADYAVQVVGADSLLDKIGVDAAKAKWHLVPAGGA